MFVLAQGCAEAYEACRSVCVLVRIQSASRNEERLSSCWFRLFVLLERRSSDVSASGVMPGAPTRPARGVSGFWIRQLYNLHLRYARIKAFCRTRIRVPTVRSIPIRGQNTILYTKHLPSPKPGHTKGGSAHGRAGRDVDGPVRPGDICPSRPPEYRRQLS